jgi:hypothetical protein
MPTEARAQIAPSTDPIVIDLHGRVSALEKSEGQRNTEIALMKKDLEYIRAGQDKVTSGMNKLFWLLIAGFLAAFVNFVIGGGLINTL